MPEFEKKLRFFKLVSWLFNKFLLLFYLDFDFDLDLSLDFDLDLAGEGDFDYFLYLPALRLSRDLVFFLLTNLEFVLFDLYYLFSCIIFSGVC